MGGGGAPGCRGCIAVAGGNIRVTGGLLGSTLGEPGWMFCKMLLCGAMGGDVAS